ncbi:MAG TPA: hypothetical protein VKD69_12460, partial [Vicinamibacterales bacterium]|nr:hypothetical protein [Vicinamibacterales bacterium]
APAAELGVYRGRFVASSSGVRTAIDVRVAHADGRFEPARVIVPVSADAQPEPAPAAPLSMLAASHGGIDVTPDRTGDLVRHLRASVRPKRAAVVGHPMRSTWWILPFATCLSTEWWLRRRRGLR